MSGIVSTRIICLFFHILCTAPLYWTRIESITISTQSSNERDQNLQTYTALLSLSMACFLIQSLYLGKYLTKITFFYCLHILLDCIGSFFSLWIAFDGLTWKTYIVIGTFCVIIPASCDLFLFLISLRRSVKVGFKQKTYVSTDKCWPY